MVSCIEKLALKKQEIYRMLEQERHFVSSNEE